MTAVKAMKPSWQVIWAHIGELEQFTVHGAAEVTGYSEDTVADAVRAWVKSGAVLRLKRGKTSGAKGGPGTPAIYAVAERVALAKTKPTVEGNLWRSMRILKLFNPIDLAVHSSTSEVSVSEEAAARYCGVLLRTGYLRVVEKAVPGYRPAWYRLAQDTGPKPPVPRRMVMVHDPNTDEIRNPNREVGA